MADNKLVTFALLGGGAWLAYKMFFSASDVAALPAATPGAAPASPTAPAAASPDIPVVAAPLPVTPTPATVNALDTIYADLKAATAGDPYFSGSGDSRASDMDHWNFYLGRVANVTPPDPVPFFPGVERGTALTAAVYWAALAPWVKSTKGLAGLGMFGGLGALTMRRAF